MSQVGELGEELLRAHPAEIPFDSRKTDDVVELGAADCGAPLRDGCADLRASGGRRRKRIQPSADGGGRSGSTDSADPVPLQRGSLFRHVRGRRMQPA